MTEFSAILGKTLTAVEKSTDEMTFICADGTTYRMYHLQHCCESVDIHDVIGDMGDLIGSPILQAEESTSDKNPDDVKRNASWNDSFTWTFYKLATIKGSVTIRWYGSSNGYYSESVTFFQVGA